MALRSLFVKRTGIFGMAYTAYRLWRRIPRKHRKRIVAEARKHGPRIARQVARKRRARVRRRR